MKIKVPEFTIILPVWQINMHWMGIVIFFVFGALALFCLFESSKISKGVNEIAFLGVLVSGLISALAYVLTF